MPAEMQPRKEVLALSAVLALSYDTWSELATGGHDAARSCRRRTLRESIVKRSALK